MRLAEPVKGHVGVSEGIESGLAAMQDSNTPVWAALSANGIVSLELPRPIRRVTIFADNDPMGIAAAKRAAARWYREGRRITIVRPSMPDADFNDMLLARKGGESVS